MANPMNTSVMMSVREQARLRARLGLPIVVIGLLALWLQEVPHIGGALMAGVYGIYVWLTNVLASRLPQSFGEPLAYTTAVVDPLMYTWFLMLTGEFGALAVGFYLFTILGFGFRIGLRFMTVCQIAAIAGFTALLAGEPYWRGHPVIWAAFLITLLVVPLYARVLIRKLHEARLHAEQESQAKSQLLAKVSHELRTPLSGIVTAAQLLAGEVTDKLVTKRTDTILNLSKDLLREINDLLDQAKHEARAVALEEAPFDLNDQLERVRLTLESTANKKGLDFVVSMDERISDPVRGDSHHLCRVLINLAGNAVKFTERGKVRVAVRLLEEQGDLYRLRFSVSDTGMGIPAPLHGKIFEPFFQIDSGTTRQSGGTGLGMTIASEIVTLMGGTIRLESAPGKGSLFEFDLDLPRVGAQPAVEPLPVIAPILGKRVLVADDNLTNLTLIKELLERDSHHVVAVASGAEALQALGEGSFDVIFLDFNMGDMDGVKVLQVYRFGAINTAPTFFLTADATVTTASRLRDAGAAGVLTKPITQEGLRLAIHQACGVAADAVGAATTLRPPIAKPAAAPAPLTAVPTQHLNYEVIEELQSISNRPQFLGELLHHAAEDINRNCIMLSAQLTAREYGQIRDSAHALKGVCASVGAVRLQALAGTLMQAPREELEKNGDRLSGEIVEAGRLAIAAIQVVRLDRVASN